MEGGAGDSLASSTAAPTWHDFLERMRHPSAADFVKSIKSFIVSFSNTAPDPERDSASLQQFLATMEGAFRSHTLWAGSSEEELESAGEGLEKYVMTKLFNRVFASVPEDVNSDEELHEKIALLQQFVRPENLDIKPNFQNETSWLLAQKELQKINMYKAPRDKLICILNCCKVINNLLMNASIASNDDPPGADEFLPVLIYVIIKANPPQLHSNLLYIQRYRCQSRLVAEAAYFFTNMLSAESFIWNIDASALSLDEVDFHKKMESARAHLFGQPTSTENQTIDTNLDVMEQKLGIAFSVGTDNSLTLLEHNRPTQAYDMDGKDKYLSQRESTSDSEKKGAVELLKDDNPSRFFQEYPFLFSHSGDLTVNDVESLLNCYKQLVLRYTCLSRALGVDGSSLIMHNPEPAKSLSTEFEDMISMEEKGDKYEETNRTKDDYDYSVKPLSEEFEVTIALEGKDGNYEETNRTKDDTLGSPTLLLDETEPRPGD